jgi:hypothetical protein
MDKLEATRVVLVETRIRVRQPGVAGLSYGPN